MRFMRCVRLQNRRRVTLFLVLFLMECPRESSGEPQTLSTGHDRTHEDGEVKLSPKLFGLTLAACPHAPFCQHLVLECAGSTAGVATFEDNSVNCQDIACCVAHPSLSAEIQRMYVDNFHRQPDISGMEHYCKRVTSGETTLAQIQLGMAASLEAKDIKVTMPYLDLVFSDTPGLLQDMCDTFRSSICSAALKRTLLSWLYGGQASMRQILQILNPHSVLRQTLELKLASVFLQTRCRAPHPHDISPALIAQLLTGKQTIAILRESWRGHHEGRMCGYLRSVQQTHCHYFRHLPPKAAAMRSVDALMHGSKSLADLRFELCMSVY